MLKDLSLLFNRIIIITNQQGIGKGLMSISDLNEIHEYMLNIINDNNGKIDKIYFCPHLASENCLCRKPSPGMIQKLFKIIRILIEANHILLVIQIPICRLERQKN